MTEPAAGPSGPGTVVMDVGGDIGALIMYTPAAMDGQEIEISRDGQPGAPTPRSGPGIWPPRPNTRPSTRGWAAGGTPSGTSRTARPSPWSSPAGTSPAAAGLLAEDPAGRDGSFFR